MALVAESVATGGVMLQPHVVDRIEDSNGKVVRQIAPEAWRTAMTPATAATLKQYMIQVVNSAAPAPRRRSPAFRSRARPAPRRTRPDQPPHAWFIAFAPADNPQYAVAVLVEHGGTSGANAEVTGGRVAAPSPRKCSVRCWGRNPMQPRASRSRQPASPARTDR